MAPTHPHLHHPLHVAVLGGGLAGLAAAVELRTRGAEVTLVEANAHLGGKMNVLDEAGFTFDMGPTILTLPEVLCGIIRRAGRRVRDVIDLVRLDPQWRCFYEDGVQLDLRDSPDATASGFDEALPGTDAARGYLSFLRYARRMNSLSRAVFFYRDVGGIRDVVRATPLGEPGIARDAAAMRLHSTVARTIARHVREPHVRQLAEHFLQYVGSSPSLAPAILSMIASAQQDQGCWYAMGGTRSVARALASIAQDLGVEFITGQRVSRVMVEDGRAAGLELESGRRIPSHAVVSNADVQRTLRDLVATPPARRAAARIARRYTPACSGVVAYLGLDRTYPHFAHHNFLFSRDPHAEFEDIYGRGIPARDPTLYVAAPSRTDPAQAPPSAEALYVLVHTPHIRAGSIQADSEALWTAYRPVVMAKLERMGMSDVRDRIIVERTLMPSGIESLYNAEGGAIYGLASHGRLTGGFKPNNSCASVPGLYLAGGSVNPGPGVPMVLMSGVTAAASCARDLRLPSADLASTSAPPAPDEHRFAEPLVTV